MSADESFRMIHDFTTVCASHALDMCFANIDDIKKTPGPKEERLTMMQIAEIANIQLNHVEDVAKMSSNLIMNEMWKEKKMKNEAALTLASLYELPRASSNASPPSTRFSKN